MGVTLYVCLELIFLYEQVLCHKFADALRREQWKALSLKSDMCVIYLLSLSNHFLEGEVVAKKWRNKTMRFNFMTPRKNIIYDERRGRLLFKKENVEQLYILDNYQKSFITIKITIEISRYNRQFIIISDI